MSAISSPAPIAKLTSRTARGPPGVRKRKWSTSRIARAGADRPLDDARRRDRRRTGRRRSRVQRPRPRAQRRDRALDVERQLDAEPPRRAPRDRAAARRSARKSVGVARQLRRAARSRRRYPSRIRYRRSAPSDRIDLVLDGDQRQAARRAGAAGRRRARCRPTGSRSVAGSSSRITAGSIARMLAIASRCFCPPESVDGSRPARSASSTSASASSTRRRSPPAGTPSCPGPNATSSRTLVEKSCASKSWNTIATRPASVADADAENGSAGEQDLARRTRPGTSAGTRPLMQRSRVDLPAPLSPMTATSSPAPRATTRRRAPAPADRRSGTRAPAPRVALQGRSPPILRTRAADVKRTRDGVQSPARVARAGAHARGPLYFARGRRTFQQLGGGTRGCGRPLNTAGRGRQRCSARRDRRRRVRRAVRGARAQARARARDARRPPQLTTCSSRCSTRSRPAALSPGRHRRARSARSCARQTNTSVLLGEVDGHRRRGARRSS